jgi:hypothetical protein
MHRSLFILITVILLVFVNGWHQPVASAPPSVTETLKATANSKVFAPIVLGMKVPVLTDEKEFDNHLGQLVAVRGTVTNSKQASIAGADVDAAYELRGQECYAVGILTKWVVTKEDIAKAEAKVGLFAHDGPGIKYHLYFDLSGKTAEAKPIPK